VLNRVGDSTELIDSDRGTKGGLVGEFVFSTEATFDGVTLDSFEVFTPTVGEFVDVGYLIVVRVSATNVGDLSLQVSASVDIGTGGVVNELGKDLLEVLGVVLNRGTNVVFILNAEVQLVLDDLLGFLVNLNGEVVEGTGTTHVGGRDIESSSGLSLILSGLVLR